MTSGLAVRVVRREAPADADAVHAVHVAAFGRHEEAELLRALRDDAGWIGELSLVACVDGVVVGHVCCTRATVGDAPALGLGPIGVLPTHQGAGLGAALVHGVLAAAEARDEGLVVLLGDPRLYGRFGFVAAGALGIDAPDPAWGAAFQARRLTAYDPRRQRGLFAYAAPFARVS